MGSTPMASVNAHAATGISPKGVLRRHASASPAVRGHRVSQRTCEGTVSTVQCRALDASVCLSVAQEEIAFGIAVGLLEASTSKNVELGEETNWTPIIAAIGSIFVCSGMIYSQNELIGKIGFLLCSIITFILIGRYSKIFLDAGKFHRFYSSCVQ